MANYGAMLRRSGLGRATEAVAERARSTRKALSRFARPQAFACPADAEAAAVRAVRNVAYFRLHYALVLWILLLATLAPTHRASMLFLMAASKVALFYGVLLRAFPNSALLRRILDRRLVLALFLIVIVVELALTDAIKHLLLALAIGVPLVLLHAVFRVRDDLVAGDDAAAAVDAAPLSEKKEKEEPDLESGSN
ncbi:PRA1 family protein F3-like [Phoenix dactylifera]|uniref:PRA1 family protein n=1 Tax=Phoenix dactylifera TaxID=42345 RepID=A0A8B7CA03_PHODC|nr:PRA1 family protein F3-like [Phoenix dactylifera]